jgi:hypothetical protein
MRIGRTNALASIKLIAAIAMMVGEHMLDHRHETENGMVLMTEQRLFEWHGN